MSQADTPKDGDFAASRKRQDKAAQEDPTDTTEPMPLLDETSLPKPQGTRPTKVDVLVEDDTPER